MYRITLLLLLATTLGCADLSSEKNSPTKEQLEFRSFIEDLQSEHRLPGLVAAISESDDFIVAASGVRSMDDNAKVKASDPFSLGSCTKAMTAYLAERLSQSGDINWDLEVSEAFPDMNIDPALTSITMHELLRHSSGIDDRLRTIAAMRDTAKGLSGHVVEQRLQLAKEILARSPLYEPKTAFRYANGGYVIAAAMMEAHTGESWEELMIDHVFSPLKMNSCVFGHPYSNQVRGPSGHTFDSARAQFEPIDESMHVLPQYIAPAGDVSCNLADWRKFTRLFLEERPELSSERAAFLLEPSTLPVYGASDVSVSLSYAYGWVVAEVDGYDVFGHSGSDGTFTARVFAFPREGSQILIATNAGDLDYETGEPPAEDVVSPAMEEVRKKIFDFVANRANY